LNIFEKNIIFLLTATSSFYNPFRTFGAHEKQRDIFQTYPTGLMVAGHVICRGDEALRERMQCRGDPESAVPTWREHLSHGCGQVVQEPNHSSDSFRTPPAPEAGGVSVFRETPCFKGFPATSPIQSNSIQTTNNTMMIHT
jgi:hypothetical protein